MAIIYALTAQKCCGLDIDLLVDCAAQVVRYIAWISTWVLTDTSHGWCACWHACRCVLALSILKGLIFGCEYIYIFRLGCSSQSWSSVSHDQNLGMKEPLLQDASDGDKA